MSDLLFLIAGLLFGTFIGVIIACCLLICGHCKDVSEEQWTGRETEGASGRHQAGCKK